MIAAVGYGKVKTRAVLFGLVKDSARIVIEPLKQAELNQINPYTSRLSNLIRGQEAPENDQSLALCKIFRRVRLVKRGDAVAEIFVVLQELLVHDTKADSFFPVV